MSKYLLDEDIKAKTLVRLLREASFDVIVTTDLAIDGQPDRDVLRHSNLSQRVLVTYNCNDFRLLHEEQVEHAGLVLVYQEPRKSMSYADIVRALTNLERSGQLCSRTLHVLNAWHF